MNLDELFRKNIVGHWCLMFKVLCGFPKCIKHDDITWFEGEIIAHQFIDYSWHILTLKAGLENSNRFLQC